MLIASPAVAQETGVSEEVGFTLNTIMFLVTGFLVMWMGCFGFNGVSQLYLNSAGNVADISRIFATTNTAAAGGVIAVLILTQLIYKKPGLTVILNGALAGPYLCIYLPVLLAPSL